MNTTKPSTTSVDTNILIRYLTFEQSEQAQLASDILESRAVWVSDAVVAEAIFVLSKVYQIPKEEISQRLLKLFRLKTMQLDNKSVVLYAIEAYATKNLDFVDLLLYAYHIKAGHDVITFDMKLNRLLNNSG